MYDLIDGTVDPGTFSVPRRGAPVRRLRAAPAAAADDRRAGAGAVAGLAAAGATHFRTGAGPPG